MSWIRIPSPDEVPQDLRRLWEREGRRGPVDNVIRVQGLNPKALLAHYDLYKAVMHAPGPLSRRERELVGTAVSVVNRCRY